MKKIIVLLALSALTGCATVGVDTERIIDVDAATPVSSEQWTTAGVGGVFFQREIMTGRQRVANIYGSVFGGVAEKMELTVETATKDRLKLGYSEYAKPPAVYGNGYGYCQPCAWEVKQGLSRSVEFDLAESKLVSFKGYLFEVKDTGSGLVTYRRVK